MKKHVIGRTVVGKRLKRSFITGLSGLLAMAVVLIATAASLYLNNDLAHSAPDVPTHANDH